MPDLSLPLADRQAAGRLLARELAFLQGEPGLLVLGLPRGGVPVALEVALALQAPLDVLVVRKLGLPGQPEYAAGALASGGLRVTDIEPRTHGEARRWDEVLREETAELARRERAYRGERPPLALEDRTVVLVDDGVATGACLEAAARTVLGQHPRKLAIAAPVGSPQALQRLSPLADAVVFGAVPYPFRSVGQWYETFEQCTDQEVLDALARAPAQPRSQGAARAA